MGEDDPMSTRREAAPPRVMVRAAYPAVRAGIAALLREAGCEVIEEPEGGLATLGPALPDVLVVDLAGTSVPGPAGEVEGMVPVVYLAEPGTPATLGDGSAQGWLPRDVHGDALTATVRAVAAGMVVLDPSFALPAGRDIDVTTSGADARLTAREHEVLALLAAGMTNKAIARSLAISEHTVKFHVGALLAKLSARSRTEAVTAAARRGLLSL
jgi:two-component system nitrate/nitrite response regulator NarL